MNAALLITSAFTLLLLPMTGSISDQDLMEKKTRHAENIFRFLALGDLEKVTTEAEYLEKITKKAGFGETSERYQEYGKEFLKVVRALRDEASRRNMAGSYYEFSRMSGMCFSCHEHIRDSED